MTTVDDAKNPRIVSTWSWMNDAPPSEGSWEKGDAKLGIFKTGVLYRINFRLVSGKQGQMIQRHRAAVENENNVHPLSLKSLRGIVNTNLANLHELAHDGTEENDDRLLIISQSTSSNDSVIATNTLLPRSRRSKPTQRMRLQMMISFSVWSC